MPQDRAPLHATNRRHACRARRRPRPGRHARILTAIAATVLSLPAPAAGQRQMHDAKAALSMLDELRVEDELSADDPGCERYVRQDYDSNREGNLEAEIIAELGGIYSPYTDEWFAKATETDIEHIVAASEAHRSGMCLEGGVRQCPSSTSLWSSTEPLSSSPHGLLLRVGLLGPRQSDRAIEACEYGALRHLVARLVVVLPVQLPLTGTGLHVVAHVELRVGGSRNLAPDLKKARDGVAAHSRERNAQAARTPLAGSPAENNNPQPA